MCKLQLLAVLVYKIYDDRTVHRSLRRFATNFLEDKLKFFQIIQDFCYLSVDPINSFQIVGNLNILEGRDPPEARNTYFE